MNWGTKIIIGMLCFMSFIIVLAVLMFRSDADALVEKDYYEKGLKYDETYHQKENVIKDKAMPVVTISDTTIHIAFKTTANGSVKLIRISNKSMDREQQFDTGTGNSINISKDGIAGGRWKVLISWHGPNNESYLAEQEIFLP